MHYPAVADQMGKQRFDLILAGHSHGGQVRLPLWGPIVLPPAVGHTISDIMKRRRGRFMLTPVSAPTLFRGVLIAHPN